MKQEFLQQVENLVEASLGDIHTAMLATILEYDSDECTVSVQPSEGKYRIRSSEASLWLL